MALTLETRPDFNMAGGHVRAQAFAEALQKSETLTDSQLGFTQI